MSRNTFKEALDRFRREEQPEVVLLVASDKAYVNIAAAWVHCNVRPKRRLTKRTGTSDDETWAWLWQNCRFSRDALREMSGVSAARFEGKLNALIANRVLYPDGSVNSFVKRYLRERVLKLLGVDARTKQALLLDREASPARNA